MPPGNPGTNTQDIHPNNEVNNIPQIEYSEAAKNYQLFRRRRLISARDQRDTALLMCGALGLVAALLLPPLRLPRQGRSMPRKVWIAARAISGASSWM
jgi:hypothetical protein